MVALAPDGANWRDLGVALERAGDPEGALEAWDRATAADPEEVLALTYAARLHAAAGRREPALAALREALRRDPKHPTARRMLLQLRGGG
ncbi:MAG: tetratricopeptide repeat protein [Planctomycetota bacterium]